MGSHKIKRNKEVVLNYVSAINNADILEMDKIMSNDLLYIDSAGKEYRGKEVMIQAWITYFTMFPDYKIEVTEITENDAMIGLFGSASGTFNEKKTAYYRLPAAWKVIVREGNIVHWQVYCESKKIEEIMKKYI